MVYLYNMKNKGIRSAKQEKAHSYLRARLLLLQDGAPLPGIRKMCAESGLGRLVLVIGKVPEKLEDSPFPTRFEDSPESLARMAWEVMSHYPAGALQLTPELQLLPGKSVMALER